MTDTHTTRITAELQEICEELLDTHHGVRAPMQYDAASFGRGAHYGWDTAVSAFYKRAVAKIEALATPQSPALEPMPLVADKLPASMSILTDYRLIPKQPSGTTLEVMASNLSDEFGPEVTRTNKSFALAVYDEIWAAGLMPDITTSKALSDIAAERRRQIEVEGWTPEHDDAYVHRDLAKAAACYATGHVDRWPWSLKWWKPSNYRRSLVKAGAIILAEIERLDRLPAAPSAEGRVAPAPQVPGIDRATQPIKLTYRNYRGEISERTITPQSVWYGSTDWHPEPQWLLTAFDHDKQAERDFALKDFGQEIDRDEVRRVLDIINDFSSDTEIVVLHDPEYGDVTPLNLTVAGFRALFERVGGRV